MKLMVLDGNSLINRAYHGVRPLTARQGLHTNAIFGFLTTMQRLVDEESPTPCALPSTAASLRSATRRTRRTRPSASPWTRSWPCSSSP